MRHLRKEFVEEVCRFCPYREDCERVDDCDEWFNWLKSERLAKEAVALGARSRLDIEDYVRMRW